MESKRKSNYTGIATAFLFIGAFLLFYSFLFGLQIAAFIGLGLILWGAIFASAKTGKYVDSALLDATTKSTYSTTDRVIDDFKLNGQAYFLPAYPKDTNLPQYYSKLKEPIVFISELPEVKPSFEELTAGKFLGEKNRGVFLASPGSGIIAQIEKQLKFDISKMEIQELMDFLSKSLTEQMNLAKYIDLRVSGDFISLRATGVLYENLYRCDPPLKSLSLLGCPLVSAVASAFAKSTSRMVNVHTELISAKTLDVAATFSFLKE